MVHFYRMSTEDQDYLNDGAELAVDSSECGRTQNYHE